MLEPRLKGQLWTGAGAILAVVLGYSVAQGAWLLPAVAGLGATALVLYRLRGESISLVLVGVLLAGYVIGNRGFAQIMLVPSLPLLPGEAVLATVAALQFLERTRGSNGPRRIGVLDLAIGAWLALGAARVVIDVRTFGFVAVRDFAMVYYAVFFFLAHNLARRWPWAGTQLVGTLRISAVIMGVLYGLTEVFPGFFLNVFTLRGVPLIYYKGDLVGACAALGSALQFIRYEQTRKTWNLVASLALVALVIATNNRAAMLGLGVVMGWMLAGRRWRYAAWLGVGGVVAAVLMLAVAAWRGRTWESTPLYEVYERVISLADPLGTGTYRGEDTSFKGDNNRFRTVWWSTVIDETLAEAPVFGLGFGYDLAARFQRDYYAIAADDFNVRSPHSILVTTFGRMGAVGLGLFLIVIVTMAMRTWRVARTAEVAALAPWCVVWTIFVSACFGVVLEGPMGAVIFWVMLGIGQAATVLPDPTREAGVESETEPHLLTTGDLTQRAPARD